MLDPGQRQLARDVAFGVAQGVLKPVHDLLLDLCRPVVAELSEAWQTDVRVWRVERAARHAQRVRELLEPLGINRRDVPLRFFLRTVEEASMEEDDELQDMFAALLASAANADVPQVHPSFVDILRQLTVRDAKLLLLVAGMQLELSGHAPYEPVSAFTIRGRSDAAGFDKHECGESDFRVSADTLVRLRLLDPRDVTEQTADEAHQYAAYILTDLAWAFLRAVSAPGTDGWKLFQRNA